MKQISLQVVAETTEVSGAETTKNKDLEIIELIYAIRFWLRLS